MIIKTYKELEEYVDMFKKQNCDLLIIKSRGGLGKTSTLKRVMNDTDYVYVNTHSTPLQTFKTLYEKQDCPVVFDDIDAIFSSSILVSLLKALADISPVKELHYNTTSKLIGNVPSSFKTTSKVCILLNDMDAKKGSLAPLIDRGFYLEFEPSKEEVLNRIKELAKSQSIPDFEKCVLDFIEVNYKKIEDLSLRTYMKALQLFRDNPKNWKERFMKMIGFDEKAVEYLILKERYKTDKERVEKFKWSRATFFRVKQEVEGE